MEQKNENYKKLSDLDINLLYDILSEWEVVERKYIYKIITLSSFSEAVNFVKKIAKISDKINHHPDIEIYDYKKLKIKIYTHELNCLTNKDIELAKKIDESENNFK
ncbi:MAG: 4a-hydroxytetrahydrobiopterin dehydratase [Nanoarchaeota archaeon]